MLKKIVLIGVFFLVVMAGARILFSHDDGSASPVFQESESYEVDPRFREFYQHLGGEPMLGKAISPKFTDKSGKEYQYVLSALMIYDHRGSSGPKFMLAPIGRDLNVEKPSRPAPKDKSRLYRNGHYIYGPFGQVFDSLGGEAIVGEPLSDPIYDPSRQITIQYFENLGFYIKGSDSSDQVRLLYYGLWKCGKTCSYHPQKSEGNVDLYLNNEISFENYAKFLTRKITGKQLTDVQKGLDGRLEQVFENLVLVADPLVPGKITLRPLTSILGYPHDPLQKHEPVNDAEGFFWPIEGDLGYQVRDLLLDFVEPYGGRKFSGAPITNLKGLKPGIERQCFENICLEYSPFSFTGKVWLSQLGKEYFKKYYQNKGRHTVFIPLVVNQEQVSEQSSAELQNTSGDSNALTIYTWAAQTLVSSGKQQVIGIGVYRNGRPVQDVDVHIIVDLPDGSRDDYYPGGTEDDGRIFVPLKPISAPNGTRIVYHACVFADGTDSICTADDFIIWGK